MKELLRRAARELDADAAAVARVSARVVDPRRALREAAAELEPEVFPHASAAPGVARSARRPRPLVFVVAAAGLAALALVAVGQLLRPAPPLAVVLSADAPTPLPLTGDVRLVYDGEGAVSGPPTAPRLDWRVGTLDVDVTPHQGVDLHVTTPEADVAVVGTSFRVDRGPLGTRVDVTRGRVSVTCAGGAARAVDAGDSTLCVPDTAAGLLARARALRRSGASAVEVLAALDAGLARTGPPDPVDGELLAAELDLHVVAGDDVAAAAVAHRYLDRGYTPRRAEVTALAATLDARIRDRPPGESRP